MHLSKGSRTTADMLQCESEASGAVMLCATPNVDVLNAVCFGLYFATVSTWKQSQHFGIHHNCLGLWIIGS